MPKEKKALKKSLLQLFSQNPALWFFGGLILIGLCWRFFQLGSIPVSLYWDEVAMLIDAKSIAATGQDMHGRPWFQLLFPSYGDYKLPVYIWLTSLATHLVGATNLAVRLPSALAGLGTIMAVAWFSWLLANDLTAAKTTADQFKLKAILTSLVVISTAPWAIMFARTGFEGHLGQFWLAWSVAVSLWSVQRQKPTQKAIGLLVATLVGVLATYSYFSIRFVWPIVFVATILAWTKLEKPWLDDLRKPISSKILNHLGLAALGIGLYSALLLPMIRSPLYADSNQLRLSTPSVLNSHDFAVESNSLREMAGNATVDRAFFHRDWLLMQELADHISEHMSLNFLFVQGDTNLRHGTGQHGLFLVVFAPFFIWGWFGLWQRRWQTCLWLLAWWLAAILPASVPNEYPHALRSLNALVPLSLVIGFGLVFAWDWLTEQAKKLKLPGLETVVLSIAALTILFWTLDFGHFYFSIYPETSKPDWHYGHNQVGQAAIQAATEADQVVLKSVDRLIFLWVLSQPEVNPLRIQDTETAHFQFQSFENIRFDQNDPNAIQAKIDQGATIALVTRASELNQILEKMTVSVLKTESIRLPDVEDTFVVVYLTQQTASNAESSEL